MEFIETLLIKNGNIINLDYHLKRMERTIKYFKFQVPSSEFRVPSSEFSDKLRIRITYNQYGINNIEFFPIKKRKFKRFKLIKADNFDYKFKYKNREFFTFNFSLSTDFDEFILIKNNLITDTTISNLAFYTGKEWLTPKYPLLKGTKRAELLDKGFLKEKNIHKSDLKYFKKMAMINAVLGFREIEEYDIIS